MPIYVYVCPVCANVIEKLRKMADMDRIVVCPECGGDCRRKPTAPDIIWRKRWIPTKQGWVRGDMG